MKRTPLPNAEFDIPGKVIVDDRRHLATGPYPVDGEVVELYTLKTLAAVLGISSRSWKRWEAEKLVPPSMWKIAESFIPSVERTTHWYSKVQIQNIRGVIERFSLNAPKTRSKGFALLNAVYYKKTVLKEFQRGS